MSLPYSRLSSLSRLVLRDEAIKAIVGLPRESYRAILVLLIPAVGSSSTIPPGSASSTTSHRPCHGAVPPPLDQRTREPATRKRVHSPACTTFDADMQHAPPVCDNVLRMGLALTTTDSLLFTLDGLCRSVTGGERGREIEREREGG